MTSLRRPVPFLLWACLLAGVAAAAGIAGLHWWVIAVVGATWVFVVLADRSLRRSSARRLVARAPGGAANAAGIPELEEADALVSVSAVVAAPPRRPAAAVPSSATEPTGPPAQVAQAAEPEAADAALAVSAAVAGTRDGQEQAAPTPAAGAPPPSREAQAPSTAQPSVVTPGAGAERRWSIWTLDRLARETADDELRFLVFSLQDYADIDGLLPIEFDSLVRESFGEFLGSAAA